ncbi:hypothetical protein ARMSODRAFT_1021291 [Armillaria solidipes]|uniref:Uncharacterized protein n=1 Tax=Armillaria solidipes TaxID=1076256 RepID=A0A2H3BTV8_9AGAR|nr:hypothetical protein ARMSODRAFT_1021291 [Armillaria solidipes]
MTAPFEARVDVNRPLLPSIADIVHVLIRDLVSFRCNALSLFIQTVLAAPMRQAAILPILVTVRDILVEFLIAVSATWEESYLFVGQCHSIMTDSERPEEFQQGERHLRALHKSRMQAIRILPFLEGILDKAEELLALELRGSYIVEHLLCFTKRFCRISSYRLGVTERVPDFMKVFRRDAHEILTCLHNLEKQMSRMKTKIWDSNWRARINRPIVSDWLVNPSGSGLLLRHGVASDSITILQRYGSRQVAMKHHFAEDEGLMLTLWDLLHSGEDLRIC